MRNFKQKLSSYGPLMACLTAGLALGVGCGDDGGAEVGQAETGTGDGDGDGDGMEGSDAEVGDGDTGDGDGDTGDGDGDTGDGDGDTGDGDGDTGDGDGDTGDGDGDGDTGDGDGDTGDGDGDPPPPPPPDADGDGIPDANDPFPNDPNLPGVAQPNLVYAHTSSRLYTMDPFSYQIAEIGQFSFNQNTGSVTDIAIDRFGVLYAVTFNHVFVCHPQTAACYFLGSLPTQFNGLTMVPPGTIDPDDDTLIGIANNGNWYVIDIVNQQAQLTHIGAFGNNMTSAGDVFSIQGTGTFGAVNKPGVNTGNVIVECDPTNGNVIGEIATTVGYSTIYGLAGWQDKIFAFNSGGQIIEIDPLDNSVTLVASTPHAWWGAGVFTILPQ